MGNPNQVDLGGMELVVTDIVLASTPGGAQTKLDATEIAVLDGVTAGTALASKALVLNSSKGISTITSATITTLTSTTITPTTIAGNANFSGTPTFAAGATVTGSVTTTGITRSTTSTALTASGTASLDPTLGELFTCTPTNTLTINAASAAIGTRFTIRFLTSGTSSFVVTFGSNFKTTGTLATGTADAKYFMIHFMADGTNCIETGRTVAI